MLFLFSKMERDGEFEEENELDDTIEEFDLDDEDN